MDPGLTYLAISVYSEVQVFVYLYAIVEFCILVLVVFCTSF